MEFYKEPQALEAYLNTKLDCSCGRTHFAPIKYVSIGKNALDNLPVYIKEAGYKRPFIICDPITFKIAGQRSEGLLRAASCMPTIHTLTHLGYDESTLGEFAVSIPADADVVIAVGTGSITDLTRYITYKMNLPCITVATAAPMDGFAASIGIVNVNNLKATMPAHNTQAIFGDTEILKNAPYRMTVAGFGDLIGKLSCLNDWELSHIINGEHICPNIIRLVRECVDGILSEAPAIKNKDQDVLGHVMNGLVMSGVAISLYGDSRPASGAEHHMSHYWETLGDQRGKPFAMHGEQVAVGTVLALMLAEALRSITPDFDAARERIRHFSKEQWENDIRRAYGSAADEVFAIEAAAGKNEPNAVLLRISSMEKHWPEITAQLATLAPSKDIVALLREIGAPACPQDIGIEASLLKDTLIYCKELRPRYTLLQLIWDLGLSEALADELISKLY